MNTENKDIDEEAESKHPRLWGGMYILLGLMGVSFAVYALISSFGTVPLYGTVTSGVLVGVISLVLIAYGYRVMKRDY